MYGIILSIDRNLSSFFSFFALLKASKTVVSEYYSIYIYTDAGEDNCMSQETVYIISHDLSLKKLKVEVLRALIRHVPLPKITDH